MNQQEIAAHAEEQKYREKCELMRKLYTPQGFFQYYFSKLSEFNTDKECFEALNDLHEELFGVPRYSDYYCFKKIKQRYLRRS